MTHTIQTHFDQSAPLPIPHCFGFPEYTEDNVYDLIVPEDFILREGDRIGFTQSGYSTGSDERVVKRIVERRAAKGHWDWHPDHKNPHFVRLEAVPKPVAKKK